MCAVDELVCLVVAAEFVRCSIEVNLPFEQHGDIGHVARVDRVAVRPNVGDRLFTCLDAVKEVGHMAPDRHVPVELGNLGIEQANRFGEALMDMMENSNLPGHYLEMFERVRQKGLREALRIQRDNYGYPDEIMTKESARLKAERENLVSTTDKDG